MEHKAAPNMVSDGHLSPPLGPPRPVRNHGLHRQAKTPPLGKVPPANMEDGAGGADGSDSKSEKGDEGMTLGSWPVCLG